MTKAITTSITSNEKNQATLTVAIDNSLVNSERQESIKHLGEHVTIKGFRKGKAPKELIEKELDPQKVVEHTINHLLPKVLDQAIKDHSLNTIGYPKIKVLKTPTSEAWEFELIFALKPAIDLKDYKKIVKDAKSPEIWTPKDGEEKEKADDGQIMQKVFSMLLEAIKFDIPSILVEDEVQQSLSRLIQQTQTLGLNLDEYLKSIGKTPEQIREDYSKAASDNLKLELIIDAISNDLSIEVGEKEVEAMIQVSGDEQAKKRLDTPSERRHISAILRQRKTLDALLNL